MNIYITYLIITALLVVIEFIYFHLAEKYNIIDKPNERSSHSNIVLRGGGIIFALSVIVWMSWQMLKGSWLVVNNYLPFLIGLVLIAGVSFWDDIKSLPDGIRLVVQFVATGVMTLSLNVLDVPWFNELEWYIRAVIGIVALIVIVGATDVYNFMDGINGITATYSLSVLIPLILINEQKSTTQSYIEPSMLIVVLLAVIVFSWFNLRPKGNAKCFAGDVGSVSIAFILLYAITRLIVRTGDVTWLVLLLVYGVDGCCTIIHRLMLHEHIGQAHRKHAYQIMANEMKIGHVKISLMYMSLQLIVSLGFIYLCPDTVSAHWAYLAFMALSLVLVYILFMKKNYHLHEEWLHSKGSFKDNLKLNMQNDKVR